MLPFLANDVCAVLDMAYDEVSRDIDIDMLQKQ